LNLPANIPSEYLEDFLGEEAKESCTSYPEDIKIFGSTVVLTDGNGSYIGRLRIGYYDKQLEEEIGYMYFSKAGKIACTLNEGRYVYNIDAKVGWNKVYVRGNYTTDPSTGEFSSTGEVSTKNLLTKEVKWVFEVY